MCGHCWTGSSRSTRRRTSGSCAPNLLSPHVASGARAIRAFRFAHLWHTCFLTMQIFRRAVKQLFVLALGDEVRPRRILRGLASGCRIVVSPNEHLGYLLGTAEPHLERAIRKYVRPGDTTYDIGANLGYVTLSLSTRVGPSGQVFSFEPLPNNLTRLREAVSASHRANITVLDFAASDSSGTAMIRTAGNDSMASLVWHKDDPAAAEYSIRTEPIDRLVASGRLPKPAFVKIDVEGADGKVIQGMTQTIAECRPVIFVECSESGREISWSIMKGFGYRCESATAGREIPSLAEYRHSDFLWLPPARD